MSTDTVARRVKKLAELKMRFTIYVFSARLTAFRLLTRG